MSLIQSASNNGHDPYAYLEDVLTRLPTERARLQSCCRIGGARLNLARRFALKPIANADFLYLNDVKMPQW